jgi:hypothetical protein
MGYSAGNLELSILGFSDKAVASVDVTAKALRRLASAVKVINNSQLTHTGQVLEYLFNKIAKSTNQINTQNIENLAAAAKSLASISRLSNLDKMDFEKVGKGFNTLSVAIQPFLDKVREAESSLTVLDGILKKSSGKKIQGLLDGSATSPKNGGGLFGMAKMGVTLHMMRRMGRFMMNLVQAGSDYNETLNLWQVAMRDNLDVADQFVNKMQKAYGISTKTLMNAQAIFKNMVGNLGNVSDSTAYALSEALVQMSVDFSSLYNVKLNEAFNKMQAMLARQVRPIRSVSGYDITENTIYELYQTLGGTKTMRQLNNTEKQLLSIYAVFNQMDASGALGDMTKTLNTFANQSRMMTEYWAELKTWSGLLLKDLIDQSGLLVHINALLITATEIIKAIAKSRGIGDENYLTGLFETTEATNDAVDELQGKLLDFDKFRSLEGASTAPLAIDEKLLKAIAGYSSKIDQAQNAAQKLAESWMSVLGFTKDANGEFVIAEENLSKIEFVIKAIGIAIGTILGLSLLSSIVKFGSFIGTYAIIPLVKLGTTITTSVLIPMAKFYYELAVRAVSALLSYAKTIITAVGATNLMRIGIGLLIANVALLALGWDKMSKGEKVVGVFGAIGAAALAAAAAVAAFHGAWTMGTAAVAIVGGLAAITGAFVSFKAATQDLAFFANGASDIDGGTLFVAGEMGKTEAVYTGSNGKTNVANVRQMEQAFYNALSRHAKDGNGTIVVQAYIDGEQVYQNTTAHAKRRGQVWSKA